MAKTAKAPRKVKNLDAKSLTSRQAKGVKGGLLPAVAPELRPTIGDGSVKLNPSIHFTKV